MSAPPESALLSGLDPEQRAVATAPPGPLCVLAGAGTGKTRAITHRIAHQVRGGIHQPQRILAVTFTARAAGEMRTRLRGLGATGVQARTFHAAALRQLHFFWPQAVGGAAPEVIPHKAPAVIEAARRLRMDFDRAAIRDLAGEIEWAKVNLLTPATYPAAARAARREPDGIDLTAMARLYDSYDEVLQTRGVIDFEDVLLLTVGILQDRDDIARTVRGQYRHFVVDEYQDVNRLQQRLLDLWLGERDDICVVGDPAQTIYSFTGASPEHLVGFSRRHPGANVVRLVRNYRSTPQIIALSNRVITAAAPSGAGAGGRDSVQLVAQGATGPAPDLTEHADDPAEAAAVAARIAAMVRAGHPAHEIAVLFRTNSQSEAYESALSDQDVPYVLRGGERFFSRKEIRDAIVLLRGAARSDDGDKSLGSLVRDVITGAGWTADAPGGGGAVRDRWESLQALAVLADEYEATAAGAASGPAEEMSGAEMSTEEMSGERASGDGGPAEDRPREDAAGRGGWERPSLREFVAEIDRRIADQHAPTVAGVTLASLHAAKGLEWDAVFLVGLSEGLMPISFAEDPEAVEEERRLLYVGMTRARRELHLSFALARTPGARATRRVSRFLYPAAPLLGGALASGATGKTRTPTGRSKGLKKAVIVHCRGCGVELTTAAHRKTGRCDSCPPTYDEALFERLRAWRVAVARGDSVPAYVVFTDATLTAVAEAEPGSLEALGAISGVGQRKLDLYGADVLALVGGEAVEVVLAARGSAASATSR